MRGSRESTACHLDLIPLEICDCSRSFEASAMKRPSTALLCSLFLLCGFVVGQLLESHQFNLPNALAANQISTVKLQEELDTDDNPLIQGSQMVAKVARLVTPSVVHIQSERGSNTRG